MVQFRIWPPRDYHTDPLVFIDGYFTISKCGISQLQAIGRSRGMDSRAFVEWTALYRWFADGGHAGPLLDAIKTCHAPQV